MRESRTKNIGGIDYTVTQLGANAGRKVFTRLAKVMGAGADSKQPIAGMLKAISDEDTDYLCEVFAGVTSVKLEGNKSPQLSSIFDEFFAGKYSEMLQWLVFCIEVNFGALLSEVGIDLGALAVAPTALRSSSPKNVTGASGV